MAAISSAAEHANVSWRVRHHMVIVDHAYSRLFIFTRSSQRANAKQQRHATSKNVQKAATPTWFTRKNAMIAVAILFISLSETRHRAATQRPRVITPAAGSLRARHNVYGTTAFWRYSYECNTQDQEKMASRYGIYRLRTGSTKTPQNGYRPSALHRTRE